jgi:hypothetical protein
MSKVEVRSEHALLESTRQLVALSLGTRKPSSPGATQLRPRAEGDVGRALRIVFRSANSSGDVDVAALMVDSTTRQFNLDFELCGVVLLLWDCVPAKRAK